MNDRLTLRFAPGILLCGLALASIAANCNITSVNKTPINDLGTGLYLNQFQGGLYPGGSNTMPAAHAAAGSQRAAEIVPLNLQGQPNANGKYVYLSIGMSNTTQEFTSFQPIAANNTQVNHSKLVIVDGAAGGQVASLWDEPTDSNYDRVRDQKLAPWGLSEAQVQAAWVKVANASPNVALPNANAEAYVLQAQMGNIARTLKIRYPNIKLVFFSSRIYAGYATGVSSLNPEPYAYESGFAVKWVIESQIQQMAGNRPNSISGDLNYNTVAPWIGWGPYLWADGTNPRSDGLTWQCTDLVNDGTHPSESGRAKVANLMLNFLLNSPQAAPWFNGKPGDATGDGLINVADLLEVIRRWGPCPPPCPARCAADVFPTAGNCGVNVDDLLAVINNWGL